MITSCCQVGVDWGGLCKELLSAQEIAVNFAQLHQHLQPPDAPQASLDCIMDPIAQLCLEASCPAKSTLLSAAPWCHEGFPTLYHVVENHAMALIFAFFVNSYTCEHFRSSLTACFAMPFDPMIWMGRYGSCPPLPSCVPQLLALTNCHRSEPPHCNSVICLALHLMCCK